MITDPGAQTSVAGDPVNLQIEATDPEGGELRYDDLRLPAGLDIDLNTGLISGTIGLDAAGTYDVLIGILDVLNSRIHTLPFSWSVMPNNLPPVANADGSYDIYFAPEAPEGKESNWIQTVPGKSWSTMFRLYGPLEPWFEKTWRPGDVQLVE